MTRDAAYFVDLRLQPGGVRQRRDGLVRLPRRGEPRQPRRVPRRLRRRASSGQRVATPSPTTAPRSSTAHCAVRVFLGVTGASGAPYARRMLAGARRRGLRDRAVRVARRGRGARHRALRRSRRLPATRCSSASSATHAEQVTVYATDDWRSPYASGSAKVDAYVVCPCSMSTVGTLAAGAMANLIHRAASVALKERRRLVLVPRETPLSSIHLRGLATLHEAGAVILFAAPGFYHGAETVRRSRRLRRRPLPRPARDRQRPHPALGEDMTHESGSLGPGRRPRDVRPHRARLRRR